MRATSFSRVLAIGAFLLSGTASAQMAAPTFDPQCFLLADAKDPSVWMKMRAGLECMEIIPGVTLSSAKEFIVKHASKAARARIEERSVATERRQSARKAPAAPAADPAATELMISTINPLGIVPVAMRAQQQAAQNLLKASGQTR